MDKTLILNKIKDKENFKTNKDFADFLGIKPTTLSMWYKRNSIDIELIFKKCEYLNPEWLLTGNGEMLKQEAPKSEVVNVDYKDKYYQALEDKDILHKDKEALYKQVIALKDTNAHLLQELTKLEQQLNEVGLKKKAV